MAKSEVGRNKSILFEHISLMFSSISRRLPARYILNQRTFATGKASGGHISGELWDLSLIILSCHLDCEHLTMEMLYFITSHIFLSLLDDLLQKLGSLSTQALVDGLWVMVSKDIFNPHYS